MNTNRHQLLKPLLAFTVVLVLVAFAFDPSVQKFLFRHGKTAGAVGGYAALDGLGQLDTGDVPIYTVNARNNSINAQRFGANADYWNGLSDTVVDPVGHHLFVSDAANNRVLVFDLNSSNMIEDRVADYVLGQPNSRTNTANTTQDGLSSPRGMAFDSDRQYLYVIDNGNNRLLVYDLSGGITNGMNAYRVLGKPAFDSDPNPYPGYGCVNIEMLPEPHYVTDAVSLCGPIGVALDQSGNRLFVSDGSYRVVIYDVTTITNGQAAVNVLGQANFTDMIYGPASATNIGNPVGVAYDAVNDRLFVSDHVNSRVLVYDVSTVTDGEAAIHVIGQLLMTGSDANWDFEDEFPGYSRGIYGAKGIAFDAANERLFVADENAGLNSSNNRILVFDVDPDTLVDGPVAINIIGQTSYDVASPASTSFDQNGLDGPHGLFYQEGGSPADDRLYVADFYNRRIQVFNVDPSVLTPDASPAVAEPGNDGPDAVDSLGLLGAGNLPVYGVDIAEDAPGAQGFDHPEGMTMDETNHRLYVADTANNRVLVFNLNSQNQLSDRTADYVLGQSNFLDTTNGDTDATMSIPRGVALNGDGSKLFVADNGNNRVLVFNFNTTPLADGIAATNVLGQADFGLSGSGTGMAEMSGPDDVTYDSVHERLFVADAGNNRALEFGLAGGITNGMAAEHRVGTNSKWNGIALSGAGPFYGPNETRSVVDTENGVMYVGSDVGVHRCVTSSGCDEDTDYTRAFTSASITDVVYDSAHALLYAGGADGNIYTCATSSGCGTDTDWSVAHATGSSGVKSMAFDAVGSALYAGTDEGAAGAIWRCPTSSDCTNTANWASVVPTGGAINSITLDTVNQVVYAMSSTGDDYRCEVANSGCVDSADWLIGGFATGTAITSSVFDADSHRLYAIDIYGNIFWCNDTTYPCEDTRQDAPGITGAYGAGTRGNITLDASRGVLYATAGSGVYRCDTSTSCVDNGGADWTLAYEPYVSPATGLFFNTQTDALYVGLNNGILQQGLVRCSGATGCGPNITVNAAAGVTYDSTNDRLFLADEGSNRILVYDVSSIDDNENPTHVLGQSNFSGTDPGVSISSLNLYTCGGECGPPVTNLHMGLNDSGVLYVPDQMNNRIMVFDVNLITDGESAVDVIGQADFDSSGSALSATGLDLPQATLVEQGSGRIWTVDKNNNRIMVFEQGYAAPPGAPPHTASDVGGQLDENLNPLFTTNGTDNSPNNRGFHNPKGGIVDATRHLMFVVDSDNNRVLVYNLASDNSMTDRLADYVIGQQDFKSYAAATTSTTFNQPQDVVVDEAHGLLFVSDYGNNRIMVFDITSLSNGMAATAVLGQTKFNRSVSGLSAYKLNQPHSLALDSTPAAQKLFVADGGNYRVVVYDLSDGITTNEPAVAVLGQSDLDTRVADPVPTAYSLDEPLGVAYASASERLFVSQRQRNRVSVFDLSDDTAPSGIDDGQAAVHVLGQANFSSTGAWTDAAEFPGWGYTWGSAIDTNNNVLYVGTYWNSELNKGSNIYKCDLSSGCDEQSDYTLAFEGPTGGPGVDYTFYSFAFDPDHEGGVMYVGGEPNVRRCVVSTGCDDNSEWVVVKNHGSTAGASYVYIFNGILYETFLGLSACDIAATNCDAEGDWTSVGMYSDEMAYDSDTHTIYSADNVYTPTISKCDTDLADCTVSSNWEQVYTGGTGIAKMIYDPTTKSMYAGVGGGFTGSIMRCDVVSTGCDATGDWVTVINRNVDEVQSFAVDTEHGVMYAGTFLGDVLLCQTSTGCDQNSDWALSFNRFQGHAYVNQIVVDPVQDLIFLTGDSGYATIQRCNSAVGCGAMELYEPNDMVVSADGTYLFVADTYYDRVIVYNITSITDGEAPVNVIGHQSLTEYGYGTTDDKLFQPSGVWRGNGTALYVSDSDNNRVMSFSISPLADGIAAEDAVGQLTPTDQAVFTVNGANDSPNALGYKYPSGVALDATGHRLFVTDPGNNRVLMYTLNTHNQFDDHVADAVLGQSDFKGSGAATTATGMSGPAQLAYDNAHQRLFVSDAGNNRVLAFDVSSVTDGESATLVFGQGSDITSPGNFETANAAVGINALSYPYSLALDETNGTLFVADQNNNRVVAYAYDSGSGSFSDGDADSVFGQSGSYDTDTPGTASDALSSPSGVYVDATEGFLWVADSGNNRVLGFSYDTGTGDFSDVTADRVLGQSDFISSTGGTTESKMSEPLTVTKDDNTGDLYVSDVANNRILSFSTTDGVTDGEAAAAVYGQASFGTAAAGTTAETLSQPAGITYDRSRGVLWAADSANNRVLYFGPLDEVLTPGGHSTPGEVIGFYPLRIVINEDDASTDSKNVLVNVYAQYAANFTGTVDVLLSNTPDFASTIPFRYVIPRRSVPTAWNKTIAWDLCFGLPSTTPCDPGTKAVYARFYVNVPSVWPALTPLGAPQKGF